MEFHATNLAAPINAKERKMNKKEWAKLRQTIEFTYYHHKPFSTICIAQLILDGVPRTSRGVSIVHPDDMFCRRKGRDKSKGWAEKALFHGKDVFATSKSPQVLNRASYVTQDLFKCDYCNKTGKKWIGGFFSPILTEFEKQILSKKKTKEIPIKEAKNAEADTKGNS